MNPNKRIAIFLAIFAIIIISFLSGYHLSRIEEMRPFTLPQETDFSILLEAYRVIEENFIDSGTIDRNKIIYGAISGMINSLNDPYTVFMNPEETAMFLDDTEGKFEGLGMEIGVKGDQFVIVAPLEGTPADKAGILPGDIIMGVNGRNAEDLTLSECVELIRGPKGTEVTLTILRNGWDRPRDFAITRDVIILPSLEWELIGDNLAYIRFYHFYKDAYSDFNRIALEIMNSPAEGIVLDMRNNYGGYLDVAEDISGWFFEKGEIFMIEDFGTRKIEKKVKETGRFSQYPIVVIINQGTASAAEILAGALRDNRDIPLIGETSFGKGSIQRLEYLSDGSSIKVTVAKWMTPRGKIISEEGLLPDFEAEMDDSGDDFPLEKAIEVLMEMI